MTLRSVPQQAPSPEANPPTDVYDCQRCGACCAGPQGWIDVDEALDDTPRRMCQDFFGRLRGYRMGAMKMVDGQCIALRKNPDGSCSCSIYSKRPTSCREFEPGSDGCLEARDKARESGATIP
jgi:Fe-S-cluster containining protein